MFSPVPYQSSLREFSNGSLGNVHGNIARAGLPLRQRSLRGLGSVYRDGSLGQVVRSGVLGNAYRDGSLGDDATVHLPSITVNKTVPMDELFKQPVVLLLTATSVVAVGLLIWKRR